jgi:hypothetical protein
MTSIPQDRTTGCSSAPGAGALTVACLDRLTASHFYKWQEWWAPSFRNVNQIEVEGRAIRPI